MAITEPTTGGRVIEQGIMPVKITVSAAVVPGDLLGVSAGTWVLADGNNTVYAELIAGQKAASGDVITAYRMARVSGYTGTTVGVALYLSDTAGAVGESAGTVAQIVGVSLSATEIMLFPRYQFGGQLIPGAVKIFFRDSGLYIQSSADGKLKISADGGGMDDIILDGMIQPSRAVRPQFQSNETVSVDKTLDDGDIGVLQVVDTDAKTVTLPATVVGYVYTIMNGGADAAVLVTVSPNANDKIFGNGFTATDNKDALNTKATAKKGDYITLVGDGVNGWMVAEVVGTWAREA